MKILVLVPFQVDESVLSLIRDALPSDVDVAAIKEGEVPEGFIKSTLGFTLRGELEAIRDAERQGYDAVVDGCGADPGVQEARELVDIPVLGPTMVAVHTSLLLGHKVCVLILNFPWSRLWLQQNLLLYFPGFENRIVIRGFISSVADSNQACDEYKASGGKVNPFIANTVAECVKAIEEDKCDVITFGCGGFAWMKEVIQSELAKKGYTPTVVNPLPTAVEVARALVNLKLTHSRIIYPKNERLLTSLIK